jgi:hypothetical protein
MQVALKYYSRLLEHRAFTSKTSGVSSRCPSDVANFRVTARRDTCRHAHLKYLHTSSPRRGHIQPENGLFPYGS